MLPGLSCSAGSYPSRCGSRRRNVEQPAAGGSRGTAALVDDVDGEADEAAVVFLELEALQAAGGDVLLHEMRGHVAPAEAGQEVIEPAAGSTKRQIRRLTTPPLRPALSASGRSGSAAHGPRADRARAVRARRRAGGRPPPPAPAGWPRGIRQWAFLLGAQRRQEFPVFWAVALVVQALIGDGAYGAAADPSK